MRGILYERLEDILYGFENDVLVYSVRDRILGYCEEINPWLPIENAPKGEPGFLAINEDRDSLEWLVELGESRYYNKNSNNWTDKNQWTHYQNLPEMPK